MKKLLLVRQKPARKSSLNRFVLLEDQQEHGKTTVIKSIIDAITKAHGEGTTFLLLAPTGKAADRIRDTTGKPASTIHSFLAQRDWINDDEL